MAKKEQLKQDYFHRSNLIQLLKSFSKDEMKEFDKFVHSPFHNNRNDVTRFFGVLKKYHPSFDQNNFTKENIYGKFYPKEKYRDEVMRRMGSRLKALIENYLSYKHFSEDAFQTKYSLIYKLYEKKLDNILFRELKNCEEILESNEGIDELYLLNKYRLSKMREHLYYNKGNLKLFIDNLTETSDSLIYLFLYGLFYNLINSKIFELDHNAKFSPGLQTAFMKSFNSAQLLDEIKKNKNDSGMLVLAIYYSYLAFQNIEDDTLQLQLEDLLKKYSDRFSRDTSFDLFGCLSSVYSVNMREGNSSYVRKLFEANKELLRRNLLIHIESTFTYEIRFYNILTCACILEELGWAEDFLEENINKVPANSRTDLYYYFKAHIAYNRKEFETALNYVMKVNYKPHKFYGKGLRCKIYYDMNYTEQLLSFIDSYRHFLDHEKGFPKAGKVQGLNFLLNLNKLVKIKFNNDQKALPILKENILKAPSLEKEWLLEKIEELEKTQR